ncbi:MAG: 3-phosphoshikimate 1-carboxyvinyltransferase [Gemmataceae bacterium]|nr:3-phosphoshikimate 1-carboxyvinyltransferase [Gemmataceae bacterium]
MNVEAAVTYPDKLEIISLGTPPSSAVQVPGSKSITNRALVLAALQSWRKPCLLTGALQSEDTEVMVRSLEQLGFRIEACWPDIQVACHGSDRRIPASSVDLFVANSGTTMRFLTALCALGRGRYRLDGVPRMRERPIEDLLTTMRNLGINASSENSNGCPPVVIESTGSLRGPGATIRGNISSQFLSALLMVAPFCTEPPLTLRVEGTLVSEPYVKMTERMLRHWGATWRTHTDGYTFSGESELSRSFGVDEYAIEPDASAASYFFAAAAITGGRVTVLDLPNNSLQGDVAFVDILAEMGCRVEKCSSGITIHGRPLHGVDVDMNAISDTVMTLGAIACFADGPTTIRNVAHIRHKETDRLAALAAELRKLGAVVVELEDGLTIAPGPLHGAEIETYNDHRMAMSLALVGLKVPGVVIKNPGCVAKTYPLFFTDLESLR